jgi:hypothetical protein
MPSYRRAHRVSVRRMLGSATSPGAPAPCSVLPVRSSRRARLAGPRGPFAQAFEHWIVVARPGARTRGPVRSSRHRDTTTQAHRLRSRRSPSAGRGSRALDRATHQTARSERPCTPGQRPPSDRRTARRPYDHPCRQGRTRAPRWSSRSSTRGATTSRSCPTLSHQRPACAGTTAPGRAPPTPRSSAMRAPRQCAWPAQTPAHRPPARAKDYSSQDALTARGQLAYAERRPRSVRGKL